ncbi:MAG: DUF485 domain-containing protein [Actinomycetota bacterium]|nr:DUF485 domain-containing protein [Actinomycetota bacterium]
MNRPDTGRSVRVRVTSPRTNAARTRTVPVVAEIDAQSTVGEVYMRSLVRSQLRLALVVIAVVAGSLLCLPLLFALAPDVAERPVAGIPLAWLLLGLSVYPVLVAAAWWYVRAAERAEAEFSDLVADPPGPQPAPMRRNPRTMRQR